MSSPASPTDLYAEITRSFQNHHQRLDKWIEQLVLRGTVLLSPEAVIEQRSDGAPPSAPDDHPLGEKDACRLFTAAMRLSREQLQSAILLAQCQQKLRAAQEDRQARRNSLPPVGGLAQLPAPEPKAPVGQQQLSTVGTETCKTDNTMKTTPISSDFDPKRAVEIALRPETRQERKRRRRALERKLML